MTNFRDERFTANRPLPAEPAAQPERSEFLAELAAPHEYTADDFKTDEKLRGQPERPQSKPETLASSKCPICGVDQPHAHTRHELIHKFRTEALRKEFEAGLLHWFVRYKDVLPGSYGMGIHLTQRSVTLPEQYWWWPVEMLWQQFIRGAYFAAPPLGGGDDVPQMHEALQIKAHPFSDSRAPQEPPQSAPVCNGPRSRGRKQMTKCKWCHEYIAKKQGQWIHGDGFLACTAPTGSRTYAEPVEAAQPEPQSAELTVREMDILCAALYFAKSKIDCNQQGQLSWFTLDHLVTTWIPQILEIVKQGYVPGWGGDGFPWRKDQ